MNYLSLFSGIGGFEYGIQQSRYKNKLHCIGYSEIDKYAKSIYKKHYPTHKYLGDATKIKTKTLQDFNLLVGGFPCQAFSLAGKRRGFNDTRGTLFFEIARILEEKKPRYFLLENVKGLLSHDRGRTFQTILRTLSELGYNVQWQVLNSKNHGVPQNRERIYIKGYSRKECGGEVLSIGGNETKTTQKINYYKFGRQGDRIIETNSVTQTLAATGGNNGHSTFIKIDKNKNEPNIHKIGNIYPSKHSTGNIYSTDGLTPTLTRSNSCEMKIKLLGNINPSGNGMSGRVYDENGISPTLTTNKGEGLKLRVNTKKGYQEAKIGDGVRLDHPDSTTGRARRILQKSHALLTCGKEGVVTDDFRIRRLTPIECERLQGFPDDWTKYGADDELISDTQRYKCCGNAVTTNVITHIFNDWDMQL